MDIKPYGQPLSQGTSPNRALTTPGASDSQQGGGWDQQVSLSDQVLTGKAPQVLTYEHLARGSRGRSPSGSVNNTGGQRLVDRALGFDRKKFDDIESQLKGIADHTELSIEQREQQTKALTEQRDAMLKAAMDRLTGKQTADQNTSHT